MGKTTIMLLIGIAIVLAACSKTNNDQKPVYYRFTDTVQQA